MDNFFEDACCDNHSFRENIENPIEANKESKYQLNIERILGTKRLYSKRNIFSTLIIGTTAIGSIYTAANFYLECKKDLGAIPGSTFGAIGGGLALYGGYNLCMATYNFFCNKKKN